MNPTSGPWLVVKLDVDILYWSEVEKGWITTDYLASKYTSQGEASSKLLLLAAKNPDLIGKLHIKDYQKSSFENLSQGDLF